MKLSITKFCSQMKFLRKIKPDRNYFSQLRGHSLTKKNNEAANIFGQTVGTCTHVTGETWNWQFDGRSYKIVTNEKNTQSCYKPFKFLWELRQFRKLYYCYCKASTWSYEQLSKKFVAWAKFILLSDVWTFRTQL